MQGRELDGKLFRKNDPTAVYFGCKNKLNKGIRNIGYVCFVGYHSSICLIIFFKKKCKWI